MCLRFLSLPPYFVVKILKTCLKKSVGFKSSLKIMIDSILNIFLKVICLDLHVILFRNTFNMLVI